MKQLRFTSSCDQCLVVMRETEAGCLTPLGVGTEMLYGGLHLDGRKQMMESGEGGWYKWEQMYSISSDQFSTMEQGRYSWCGFGCTTFSRLTISHHGLPALYSLGGYPHGGTELMNVVHTCSLKWPAAHVWFSQNFLRLLTSRLLDLFFQRIFTYLCTAFSNGRTIPKCSTYRMEWSCVFSSLYLPGVQN